MFGKIPLHWQILGGMIIGAAIGLMLNATAGDRLTEVDPSSLPPGFTRLAFHDTSDRIDIWIEREDADQQHFVVDDTGRTEGAFPSLLKLQQKEHEAFDLFYAYGRSWARWIGDAARRFGGLFLRMLQMVAVPLIVTSLTTGVMGLGHADRLGKMFVRTLGYYLCTSFLAIITGLGMVNLIQPGLRGMEQHTHAAGEPDIVSGNLVEVLFGQLEAMIPANPIGAIANGNFLSIICFTLLFAIFSLIVGGKTAETVRSFSTAAFDVMMAMTLAIIRLAPIGVMLLMLYVTATQGLEVFKLLFWYMLTVVCALGIHAMVVLPIIVQFVARRSAVEFARAMSPALLTAFSSASSNGTLPLTLASVEGRAGVSNRVSSFVLPLGATINMDGTALYEAVAVLFIAQVYHGENLPLLSQITVAVTALMASIGAAGIPHAGLVMMVIILQAVGLPVEMQGIIIAVDRVLDMARTSVNVWSDSCGCAVIARFEANAASDAEVEVETDAPVAENL